MFHLHKLPIQGGNTKTIRIIYMKYKKFSDKTQMILFVNSSLITGRSGDIFFVWQHSPEGFTDMLRQ